MKKKKPKEKFETFRTETLNSYKTIKTTLNSVLRDFEIKPQIENLVLEINDLTIHTYQFIRLYILYLYNQEVEFPTFNETFVLYCIKTLGTRDNRGVKGKDQILLETLNKFYITEYQPLLNHRKTDLKNK